MTKWSKILKNLNAWSIFLFFRPKYHYTSYTQKRLLKDGFIVISNHSSAMDFLLLLLTFKKSELHCLIGETVYDCNPVLSRLLKMLQAIRVNRFQHDLTFLPKCKKYLEMGESILIFPESRLPRKNEKTPLPFMPTYIYLALETGKPILPIWHSPKYSLRRTNVVIGSPIFLDSSNINKSTYVNEQNIKINKELINLGNYLNEGGC